MKTASLLPCQRPLFEVPRGVSYLDAAAWTPLPIAVRRAGEAGILAKARPWEHSRADFPAWTERARAGAARLIGASADDIAIVGSVSHAMATAAAHLSPERGTRILRATDEFPSLCLPFDRLAGDRGLVVDVVPRPGDGDWAAALLAAIHRPGAAPVSIATLTPSHWTDGSVIDLDRVVPALRNLGAARVVDATQAVGAMPVEIARWQPDYLTFPTYKWTLGPYGVAFLYVAPARQDGRPLEEHGGNRPSAVGARRFDRGELHDPVSLAMAATGLELVGGWGSAAIQARLRALTDRLAEHCAALGIGVSGPSRHVGHVLGLRVKGGLPPDLVKRLSARRVFVSERSGALRISPHVWVDEDDVAQCAEALSVCLTDRRR